MSRTITLGFDPLDEGIRHRDWDAFCERRGLVLEPGNGLFYLRPPGGYVEADYQTKRYISFRTGGPEGDQLAAGLALDLWAQYGGALSASPEIIALIRYRFTAQSVPGAGLPS